MSSIFERKEFESQYLYEKSDLGANWTKDKTVFKVWSPFASNINVILYDDGEKGIAKGKIKMLKKERGIWEAEVCADVSGTYYTYEVIVNNITNEAGDPYAKAAGVNGSRSMVVNLKSTDPEGWNEDRRISIKSPVDVIIYEMHIRDISISENSGIAHKGKFLGVAETGTRSLQGEKTGLDHIKELGITHVHLLPSFDFVSVDERDGSENQYNWGYDPQNYNVPEGSYATDPYNGCTRLKEFKSMIQTLHNNGIGVILDVVYNHTGLTEDSIFSKIVPGYYYRHNEDGSLSDGAACRNETASERAMFRKYMIDSITYWAKEYHIDGFRFDLMGLHDIDTMNKIREELDKIDPQIIMYGEGWTGGNTPLPEEKRALKKNVPMLHERIAAFSDDMRDGIKGHVFYKKEAGFVNGGHDMEESVRFGIVAATRHNQIDYNKVNYSKEPWAKEPTQAVNYASAHDNLIIWDKISETNPHDTEEIRIKMNKLASVIVMTSQGIPFIHEGEEFLRTKFGDENSFKSGDAINQLDWERKHRYRNVFDYYKGLIELRKAHPAFRMTRTEDIQKHLKFIDMPKKNMIGYRLIGSANNDTWNNIVVLFNANKEDAEIILPDKEWSVAVNDKRAGIEALDYVGDGKVMIPSISAMVLFKLC